ncbi:MAG TPA: HD domain-containing protein [Sorangium sp.]|nr:HD domain-containing protein [Sorangium sp.]
MLLRDPVHGLITFEHDEEAIVRRLIETPEVQRLRHIRQLGLTSLAYPGAEHTRFAHALGAAHVMRLFIARLRQLHEQLPFWQQLTSERARDALAAALLHDIGHGPFSHLFEDVIRHGGFATGAIARTHEAWTEAILMDKSTGVHQVLVDHDPELPQRVAGLIGGQHPMPYLARAVSGTFDVDRCDYLLRDAHATGVRYGAYDLPWLLRSLRFGVGHSERAPGLAIDGGKGLSAIESFILARLFMFQQVYFHKATRAAEWMIRAIMQRVSQLLRAGSRVSEVPPALAALARGQLPSLGDYLNLDDTVLLCSMRRWCDVSDPTLSDLCQRLRARALFKTHALYGDDAEPAGRQRMLEIARDIARVQRLDPELYVALDVAHIAPYSDDSSLTVIFDDGRARRPAEVSFVLDRLRDETLTRVRLIFAAELRPAITEALRANGNR